MATAAARTIGVAALACGYASRIIHLAWTRAARRLAPTRGWRRLDADGVCLRVPPDWGDAEPLGDGTIVVHNRPRHHRVEGDAVWYGSAIELHIGRGEPMPLPALAPMSEVGRTVHTPQGACTVSLRIANGVSDRRRREALRVLCSIRPR
ncbi:MAG: hypothetical protein AB7P52_17035 [Alphaproteobacteria bacterium]